MTELAGSTNGETNFSDGGVPDQSGVAGGGPIEIIMKMDMVYGMHEL